jgi:membrane associated rhomboid family serine protease
MIPIRCDIAQRRAPVATVLLIGMCCVVYVLQGRWPLLSTGFVPVDLTHSFVHPGPSTLPAIASGAVAFFMHANLLHLVSNAWYLWLFGSAVETRLGSGRFLAVYLVSGAVSMLAQAVHSPLSAIPIVGASGAIAGVMGAHFVMLPLSKILVWIPPIFFVKIPAFVFLLFWFYVQYVSAGAVGSAHVAWWAHIGGFVAGTAWGVALRLSGVGSGKGAASKRRSEKVTERRPFGRRQR